MTTRRGGCRFRLILVALGLFPFLVLEVVLHLVGYGGDVLAVFGPEHPVFVQNGEMMELSREHRRQFRTEPFSVVKAPGTTRIFVIGDSTTYGFTDFTNLDEHGRVIILPDPYPELLERALTEKYPDHTFEVINCGAPECGTYRLLRVLREVISYSPDLLIFMAGTNDFLEYRLIENWREVHPFWAGLRKHWKTLALTRDLLRRAQGRPDGPGEGDGGNAVVDNVDLADLPARGRTVPFHARGLFVTAEDVVRSQQETGRILGNTVRNLEEVVRTCRQRSVSLILCTVPGNLWLPPTTAVSDDPDTARLFLADVPEKTTIRFNAVTEQINSLLEKGQWRQALTLLAEAHGEFYGDPRVAMLHYLEARAHEGRSDWKRVRYSLIRAKDLDPFIWRVPDGANEAIRRLSDREGVMLADIEMTFMRAVPDGIPDDRLFYDYCHFRPVGHAIATGELMAVLEREGWLPAGEEGR